MTSLITMANVVSGEDYFVSGRTVERLGLQDLWLEEIRSHVIGAGETGCSAARPSPSREELAPYA